MNPDPLVARDIFFYAGRHVRLTQFLSSYFCSDLDSNLQDALKDYLIAKGIGEDLTNFLLFHLHKKELGQYLYGAKLASLRSCVGFKFRSLLDAAESLKRILSPLKSACEFFFLS
ncbi:MITOCHONDRIAL GLYCOPROTEIN FAMILY PROTEIN [Salix viminalis]|uniref:MITOCHONDRIAL GLYCOPROTEIN FAMILY PROTEIN n=1 Tax=Salix viminalis TaxID=40686 RepID=A0A9Q0V412_SALVM|nr:MITOCHONDRIAL GLYCOPROTEIN FAMILY PROTEIN [Salix viminalis]